MTAHRRENFGEPLTQICRAVLELIARYPDIEVVWPVHPNPAVQKVVPALLGGHERIHLCPPLPYEAFLGLLQHCHIVLSRLARGGSRKKRPTLGKPENPGTAPGTMGNPKPSKAGVAQLVGTGTTSAIVTAVAALLDSGTMRTQQSAKASVRTAMAMRASGS